ncbi:MAG: YdeI/OmpD-associated family protein [Ginsengibacter sp.]
MPKLKTTIEIIGINPFVFVPEKILAIIFKKAGKDKGPIPICGAINGNAYQQTLVKYGGAWRLYINGTMLKNSPKRIGEIITVTVTFDPSDRTIQPHPQLLKALKGNIEAKAAFDELTPSKQREIIRYIAHLKNPESVDRNIKRAINFLLKKGNFAGRKN